MKKIILSILIIVSLVFGNVAIAADNGAGSDTYSVRNVYFSDLSGNAVEKIEGSGMVNVTVTKKVSRSAVDTLIISSYATDGELIGFTAIRAKPTLNSETELGTLVKIPEGKEMGYVKAYIWNNISEMVPLSNVAKKLVGAEDDAEMPTTAQFNAKLVSSYKNNFDFEKRQFRFDNVQYLYDYIEGATEEDYKALYDYFMIEENSSVLAKSYLPDMDKYLFQNVTVTVEMDEDMNLYIKEIERVREELVVETDVSSVEMPNEYKIVVYDENSSEIECVLDYTYRFVVNGVRMDYFDPKYIVDSSCGDLVLADTDNNGCYDVIITEHWGTAAVDMVTEEKIYFAYYSGFNGASVTLNPEDKVYDIYYEGEKITIEELLPGDILSIAYDVMEYGLNNSYFCEIYVSRNVVTGIYTGYDTKKETIDIKTDTESLTLKTVNSFEEVKDGMDLEAEYKIYQDYFGRIYSYEMVAVAEKYAIIDSVEYLSAGDNIRVGLYFQDGTYDLVEIDFSKISLTEDEIFEKVYLNSSYTNADKTPVENRVVEYKISSSTGMLTNLEFLAGNESKTYYSSRKQAIGTVKMNDKTKIINAMDYVKEEAPTYSYLSTASLSSLIDDLEYTAYGFGAKNDDNTYPFVIITKGPGVYNDATPLAVVAKAMRSTVKDDGTEAFELNLLCDGEEQTVYVTADAEITIHGKTINVDSGISSEALFKGDVIVFSKNKDSDIDMIDLVWRTDVLGDYQDRVAEALTVDYDALISIPAEADTWTTAWKPIDSELTTSVLYGIVVDKGDGYFKLAQVAEGEVEYNWGENLYDGRYTALGREVLEDVDAPSNGGVSNIYLSSDTNVYVYDSTLVKNQQFYVGSTSEIVKTQIPSVYHIEASDGTMIIPWDMEFYDLPVFEQCSVNLALVKVVDDEATDVFFILGEE